MNFIHNFFYLIFLALFLVISCGDTTPSKNETCDNKQCLEHEICVEENNNAVCKCEDGFEIIDGACKVSDLCAGFECSDINEVCKVSNESPVCECKTGYQKENNSCVKIPVECSEIVCGDFEYCKLISSTPTCVCNDNYYKSGDSCVFNCKSIEGAKVNDANTGCICENSNYYIDETQNKCLLKQGCRLDNINCGTGTCKEDLEHDWYCECFDEYYFDGATCVLRNSCGEGKFECGDNCCNNGRVCLNNSICDDLPSETCQNDNECEETYFCDPIVNKCIKMDDENGCIFKPVYTEEMNPLIAWQWPNENTPHPNSKHIMIAPVVANMTDDNDDGVINLKDIPDVIFSSATAVNGANAHLRIVNGRTGADIAENTSTPVHFGSSMAVGDIDNDGKNEIIAIKDSNHEKIVVFEYENNELVVKWEAGFNIPGVSNLSDGAISIADINHDGNPEIIVGNYIINNDGSERCHSTDSLLSYGANSNWKRHISIVEDINNDGFMDIITGNQFISGEDCSRIVAREDREDGYTAIADLNLDGEPDVVVISKGFLYIYDKDMNDLIIPLEVDVGNPIGGPPTIGNFDDDAELEIAVAGTTEYRVVDINDLSKDLPVEQSYVWRVPNQDASSRQTGSSLFDFEGDGIAEVLYADECYFRIYNGVDGTERFKVKNSSVTRFEYPLVVDVDNDGKSEVIVISNGYNWDEVNGQCNWETSGATFGIKVYESPDNSWVRTRRIWNQHSYHVTNVNEDGSIPVNEEHNWLTYNNYRLNVQGKGVFNSPNFVIDRIDIEREDCPLLKFKLKIKFSNQGSLSVNVDIPISIYKNTNNSKELIDTIYSNRILLPGESTILEYDYIPENPDSFYSLSVVADDKGNGTGEYNECNEVDNTKIINFKGAYTAFCKVGVGECMRFAPYTCNENNELSCSAVAGEPTAEVCGDGFDNNCNGNIDEDCGCGGEVEQDCYHASSDLLSDNSECKKGTMFCIGGEAWGECTGDTLPVIELCNGKDDDCDGNIDEDFIALGNECKIGLGICEQSGNYVCDINGNMTCDAVPLEPQIEICGDTLDNNCNGQTDERPCQEL